MSRNSVVPNLDKKINITESHIISLMKANWLRAFGLEGIGRIKNTQLSNVTRSIEFRNTHNIPEHIVTTNMGST